MARLSTIESTRRDKGYSFCRWGRRVAWTLLFSVPGGLQGVLASEQIDALLNRDEAPHGIVFEIVEADEAALSELLPRVREAILRVRQRFPQTEFAVVSHGREEFALQSQYQQEYAELHRQLQSLVAENVPVHVCETHAGWYGVSARDFPDYVNVAPSGPGQIELYRELGYVLVVIESLN